MRYPVLPSASTLRPIIWTPQHDLPLSDSRLAGRQKSIHAAKGEACLLGGSQTRALELRLSPLSERKPSKELLMTSLSRRRFLAGSLTAAGFSILARGAGA